MRVPATVLLCLAPSLGLAQAGSPISDRERPAQHHLRERLEHQSLERPLAVGAEAVHATRVLPAFYERRRYLPAWSADLRLSAAGVELVAAIRAASSHGLDPGHYHLAAVEAMIERSRSRPTAPLAADLDLLLTDAFLILGAHLVSGRVDPESFDPEWVAYRREVDLAQALDEAVKTGRPAAVLDGLLPDHPGYDSLRGALARYRSLAAAGGWSGIGPGPALRPGDADPRVAALRARLRTTDPPAVGATADRLTYDDALAASVRHFQARHGLEPDGIIGEKTLAALDTSVEERVRQIELNLERWRWLPQDLGRSYVLVNIPDFSLVAVEDGHETLDMRVVVGRRYRRTPVFSDTMRYLVLNPSWEVPYKLAVQDKLPEIRKDPEYLARLGFRVYRGWGADQVAVDPATVDWSLLSASNFPYRLRQDPGPQNALGRVKFMFPNRFNVYLHDTPTRETFRQSERDVSSGCIRLERPLELAELLLRPFPQWTREAIDRAVATGRETTVTLDRPVPVHILYWTAWGDEEGTVHFRRDLYGRDDLLAAALLKAAEGSRPAASAR